MREISMRKLVLILFMFISANASAGNSYGSQKIIKRMYVRSSGVAYVGVQGTPKNTCALWGEQFAFDTKTDGGEKMYKMILTAKALGKPIDIWYKDSAAPGTDQSNGCNGRTISVLTGVGIK